MASDRPIGRLAAGGLAYRPYGEPGAETLVFWPGLQPAAPWRLDEAGPAWADAGFRVLAVSPPGWETPALETGRYRPTALARRIVGMLDALGVEQAVFAGFSWGASIGCHLAVAVPDRLSALVLLDAGYTDFQDVPGFEQPTLEELVEEGHGIGFETWEALFEATKARTRAWRPSLEFAQRSGFHELDGMVVPRVSPEAVSASALGVMLERPSLTLPALDRLSLPILLVAATATIGEDWGCAALDRFRASVPAADVLELDSGHDLLADAPEQTITAVAAWLRDRT